MSLFDDSDSDAQNYLNTALNAYQSTSVPTIASEQVNNIPLESVQSTVNPNAIQVQQQAPSAYNNISLDPATRAAQMQALSQYQQIANTPGLDPASKLAMQQAVDAANVQSQGAQGAIMQSAQAQGQGGGDFALTQRALAAQGASNNAATQGMEAAAEAAANRQAALAQVANIGGQVNASDYGQAAAKAGAQNTINATNQAATNAANTGNVSNQIQTGEFNTTNAQGVNAANTAAGQNQVYYNAALPQQQFNNELAKAGGIAGVSTQQAGAAQNAQNASNAGIGALLGAAGTIGGAMLGGPVGAAIGGSLAKSAAPTSSSAPIGGGNSTPTGNNANPNNYGLAKGGVVCYASGGAVDTHDHAICMKLGSYVPGKAQVDGDSEKNDTVPAMLSPGELVIPRSVPKDGAHMEQFAKNAPVPGTGKKVDLTSFTNGYKRGTR